MVDSVAIPLKILHIEDYEDDSLLLTRCLARAGYHVTLERVETLEELRKALERGPWDVAVTDYVLPGFSARAVRQIIREKAPDLPVILLSGAMGEEAAAVAALHAGIEHHILKNSLCRYAQAIPLIARVVPPEEQARAHLRLGNAYLQREDRDLARGMFHYQEAQRLARRDEDRAAALVGMACCYVQMGQCRQAFSMMKEYAVVRRRMRVPPGRLDGEAHFQVGVALARLRQAEAARRAFRRAEHYFAREGDAGRVAECRRRAASIHHQPEADWEWSGCLERGRYHLMMGQIQAARAEARRALDLSRGDAVRTFHCLMLLLGCAEQEGDEHRAFACAVTARVMAMEAGRLDLAYAATEALTEVARSLGPDVRSAVRFLESVWCYPHLDFRDYIPASLLETPQDGKAM